MRNMIFFLPNEKNIFLKKLSECESKKTDNFFYQLLNARNEKKNNMSLTSKDWRRLDRFGLILLNETVNFFFLISKEKNKSKTRGTKDDEKSVRYFVTKDKLFDKGICVPSKVNIRGPKVRFFKFSFMQIL